MNSSGAAAAAAAAAEMPHADAGDGGGGGNAAELLPPGRAGPPRKQMPMSRLIDARSYMFAVWADHIHEQIKASGG